MQLPIELKRLIERNKAQYGLVGEDDEILKKIIPSLEDEDIIKLYDELCEEENQNILKRDIDQTLRNIEKRYWIIWMIAL